MLVMGQGRDINCPAIQCCYVDKQKPAKSKSKKMSISFANINVDLNKQQNNEGSLQIWEAFECT